VIVRTPTRLEGGITDEERAGLEIHAKRWIDIAYQTGRANRPKLVKAIEGLYRAAELNKPAVEIVPSPKAMVERFARPPNSDATRNATLAATLAATNAATDEATCDATRDATREATYYATREATENATHYATYFATYFATQIAYWWQHYQGGNMLAMEICYLTAFRDVLGLRLPVYRKFQYWEKAAIYGGFRLMFSDRCIVSDFPDRICVDPQWRPHCDSGPSHRWSDGWELWYLNGLKVDEQLVMRPKTQTIQQIENEPNEDIKAIRIERYGWPEYLRESGATLLDERRNDIEGTREALYRQQSGGLRLVVTCPTGRHPYALRVGDRRIRKCETAQNWLAGEKPFRTLART